MGTKRDSRAQKKREKDARRATERKRAREGRLDREREVRQTTLEQAMAWPVGDAFVSEDWHAQGPQVRAVFTRQHPRGAVAAMIFDVDLRERGVRSVEALMGVPEGELHLQLARHSRDKALVVVDPGLVVKVVSAGRDHGRARGFEQPAELDAALAFFGDTRPSVQEVLVGHEPPPPPPKEGLIASLRRRIAGG